MIGYVANIKELTERSTDFHRIPYSGSTAVLSQTFSGHQFLTELIQDLPNCFDITTISGAVTVRFQCNRGFWGVCDRTRTWSWCSRDELVPCCFRLFLRKDRTIKPWDQTARERSTRRVASTIGSWVSFRMDTRSKRAGSWLTAARRALPNAVRNSVPMLNLQIFEPSASARRCANGTPEPP